MKNVEILDSLLEVMQTEWGEEDLGAFLCNVYALGYSDALNQKDTDTNQNFLLMSPIMQVDMVYDYILNSIDSDLIEEKEINWDGSDIDSDEEEEFTC